jgi:hypothetical protein
LKREGRGRGKSGMCGNREGARVCAFLVRRFGLVTGLAAACCQVLFVLGF